MDFQLASLLDDIRVFADHQPANVREEEPPDGVVRVSIRLGIFVVNPVVSSPLIDIILRVQVNTEITYTVDNTWHLGSNCYHHNAKCVLACVCADLLDVGT